MRYNATDIIRRGFDSMLANWPLLLIRVAELVVLAAITIAAVLAAVIPIVLSIVGGSWSNLREAQNAPQVVAAMLIQHIPLFLFLFLLVSVLLLVFMGVHSFVDGGSVRIYVDGEFAARAVAGPPPRAAFRAFAADRWLQGAKRDWWPIFWIYNFAWSVGLLIILVPLLAIMVIFLIGRANPVAIVAGCLLFAVTIFVMIFVGIVTGIWCQKAIVICVARTLGAVDSLREAWTDIRTDFTRHFVVAFVLMMISFGTAMLISFVAIGAASVRDPAAVLMLMPIRLGAQLLSNCVSLMVAAWMAASFAALTIDR